MQIRNVENLKKIKKYLTFKLIIDFGTKIKKEKNVDKHKEEKPTNEIIYNLFSIDCFFLILFLLKQAYNFHHVLRKPSMQ